MHRQTKLSSTFNYSNFAPYFYTKEKLGAIGGKRETKRVRKCAYVDIDAFLAPCFFQKEGRGVKAEICSCSPALYLLNSDLHVMVDKC